MYEPPCLDDNYMYTVSFYAKSVANFGNKSDITNCSIYTYTVGLLIISTASVYADEKCWKIKQVRARKGGFIRCQKSMIFIEEVKLERRYYRQNWRKIDCPLFLYPDVKNLLKYNGLVDLDEEIFSTLEKYANNCYGRFRNSRKTRVCIVFDCIHGMC